ncbi:transposase family protein [Scytonema sp. UIC 10036]|uniref:transposase family protein n=1 Tax=Scytonema sp. UIC 10036 TaxID=2304196 RepID=UPI00325C2327
MIAGEPGAKSDITLFRESQKDFEPNQKFQGDKGYIGEPSIKTPTKKPKKGELTLLQKEKNKEMASSRIFVEHLIRLLKILPASKFCAADGDGTCVGRVGKIPIFGNIFRIHLHLPTLQYLAIARDYPIFNFCVLCNLIEGS